MKQYNYIFAGAGLSSLMTVYKMILSKKFHDKTILLIDQDSKKNNDRTWCFWDKPGHQWENVVSKKWHIAMFADQESKRNLDLMPYEYNLIRSLDFYKVVFGLIRNHPNITFINDQIINFTETKDGVCLICKSENYFGEKLFNSIYDKKLVESQTKYALLQQHFVGWFIKSEQEVFDPEVATFMDFSLKQNGNTKFMYVLPTSKTEALLEPTLFSHHLLKLEEYEQEIQNYALKLGVKNFEIIEKEKGSIPMTGYKFWKNNTKNVLNIGTAGGWTKASTGFTFYHTNKKTDQLVAFLNTKNDLRKFHKKSRFWFYDLIFLDVLDKRNEIGSAVFGALFKTGNSTLIFKFLNEETSFFEDLQVMWKCPKVPFVKALFRVMF